MSYAAAQCSIYVNGKYYALPRDYTTSSTVQNGVATFYLTDDGTANGNAVYSEVFLGTVDCKVRDAGALYQQGLPTLSTDKKTLTVPINRMQIGTSAVTVLNISVLGSITQSMVPAVNGTPVDLMVEGVA